jgi:hypothetical protein
MNEKWKSKQTADRFQNIMRNIMKLDREATATHARLYVDRELKASRCRCYVNKKVGILILPNCSETQKACEVTKCPLLQVPDPTLLTRGEKEIVDVSLKILALRKSILINAASLFDSAAQFCCHRSPKSSITLNTRSKTIRIHACLADIKKGTRFVRQCGIDGCRKLRRLI